MWTKRKHGSHLQASNRSSPYDDSWEELGFADDGRCIWPPRSYSCSFCTREFRSAQALGGHMNVHRRDRARLKQSPPLPHSELFHHQQQHHDHQNHNNLFRTPYSSLGFQYPSHQICTLIYSPIPNSDPAIVASPSSPSKASITPPARGNCDEKNFFPSFSSSTKKDKQVSPRSSPSSWPNILDPTSEREKKSRILESGCRAKVDYFKNDLSVSLNFVVKRACPTISDGDDDDDDDDEEEEEEEEETIGCKRRRTSTSTLPIFIKTNNSVDRHHVQSEVYEIGPCSLEELDLELRLGDRPKVK